MSKDFESELKKYAKSQTPDLWDRIAEGIAQEDKTGEAIVFLPQKKHSRTRTRQKIRLIGSAAACLMALLLAVPVFWYVKESNESNQSNKTPQMHQDNDEAMQFATAKVSDTEESQLPTEQTGQSNPQSSEVTQESVELQLENGTETEHDSNQTVPSEKPDPQLPKPTADSSGNNADTQGDANPKDGIAAAGSSNLSEASAAPQTEELVQYTDVSVSVTAVWPDGLLKVSVIADPSKVLAAETELKVDAAAVSNVTFTVGNRYKITFQGTQTLDSEQTISITAAVAE